MSFALLLWVGASHAGVDVLLPNGEFSVGAEDLRVKVPGGAVVINRKWANGQWYLNQSWADLKLTYDNLDGSVALIDRAGSRFERSGNGIYVFDKRFFIKATASGYQWYDQLGSTIDYDTNGKIQSYADRNGIRVSFAYDGSGNMSQILDHYGNGVMRLSYAAGVLASIADAGGRTVQYQFTNGNLTRVTDVLGNASSYTYDAVSQLLTLTDAENRTTTLTYAVSVAAPAGRWGTAPAASQQVAASSGTISQSTGAPPSSISFGRVGTVTDPMGKTTTYQYDYDRVARQYTSTVVTPAGKKTVSIHDAVGNMLQQTLGSRTVQQLQLDINNVETTFDERGLATRVQYDSARNPLTTTYPDGTSVTATYDPVYSNPLLTTDEAGVQTKYDYDSKGNLLTQTEAVGLPEQRVTTYTYDQYGQMLTRTRKGATSQDDATVSYTYDGNGNVTTLTDALGNQTQFTYDAIGNALTKKDARGNTTSYAYNAAGWPAGITDALNHSTAYVYDKVGNRTKATDALGNATNYSYDGNNRLTIITDALGGMTQSTYDADGNKMQATDANGVTTGYAYDGDGRLTTVTDGNGNATGYEYGAAGSGLAGLVTAVNYPTYREEYKYDQRNRVTQRIQVLDTTTRFTSASGFDATGNLVSQSDALNRTSLNKYDALRRLVQATDALGGLTQYSYNTRDNLVTITDANGNTTRYAYDKNTRRVSETRPAGEATQYAYDGVDNLTLRTDAKGQRRKYTYDAANRRVKEEHYPFANGVLATNPSQTIVYAYDGKNQLTAYDDGNTNAAYTLDALGRKTADAVNYGAFSKTLQTTYFPNGIKKTFTYADGTSVNYTYDGNNQLKTITTPSGTISYDTYQWTAPTRVSLPGATRTMTYDPILRPTEIKVEKGAAGSNQAVMDYRYTYNSVSDILQRQTQDGAYAYTYDNLDRLLSATPPAGVQANAGNPNGLPVEQYTYDGVHNRLSSTHQPGAWSYNANNQLTQYGTGSLQSSWQYDANGHLIKQIVNGQETDYQYDVAERLVAVTDASNNAFATYTYDPFGRRVAKVANGQTTFFQYADEGLVAEYGQSGNVLASYGWQPGGTWGTNPQFKREGTNTYFFTTDHLGTAQQLTDVSGNTVWKATVEAFGKTIVDAAATVTNNLRFPGQYYDVETNTHYNYYRDYDPTIGRYVQSDPIGLRGGINTYLYVGSNPVRWIDPFGLQAVEICNMLPTPIPHTFVCVGPNCSGKYPSGNPFWSPGSINDDSPNKPSASCYPVPNPPCGGDAFAKCVSDHLNKRGPSGDRYNYLTRNCGEWATNVIERCRRECGEK